MKSTERALEAFLVAAARTGDRGAMAQLVEFRGPRLLAHATRLLGEREGARDAVQDAWAEILRGLDGLRDEHAFLPWALRIVSRRVARVIRGRQRDRRLAGEYAAETDPSVPEGGPAAVDAAVVRRAIESLPPDQAATVALFYLEDMSVHDVAIATDVPAGTVKTRLMHARTKLRSILEGETNGKAG
jgi:RNA polymerase sigma-70 factor (ECF subfamily)